MAQATMKEWKILVRPRGRDGDVAPEYNRHKLFLAKRIVGISGRLSSSPSSFLLNIVSGPGYQGKSGNFKGSKAQMECYYCHKPGQTINIETARIRPLPLRTRLIGETTIPRKIPRMIATPTQTRLPSSLVSRITGQTMNLDQLHFNGAQTLQLIQQRFPILNQTHSPGSSTLPPTPILFRTSNVSTNT